MSGVKNVSIHSTAVVSSESQIAEGTSIGPYAVVEDDVVIGKDCKIASHAIIRSGARIGDGVKIDSFAVIAGLPQDIKFDPETPTFVEIGNDCIIREGVTIHRATKREGVTRIGDNCFLMGNCHIAHDCCIGNYVAIANGALLAGHVHVDEWAFLGGGVGIHQFVRIGESAILSGNATMMQDVPPFVTAANRNEAHGLNLVGLKRRGFDSDTVHELRRLYKEVLFKKNDPKAKAQKALDNKLAKTPQGEQFLKFFMGGTRSFIRSKS